LHWFHDQIWLPILLSMIIVAIMSTVAGILILRRRGVYFSLLTLALAALTYTIAFRWTEVTGGEDGLSGLKRGAIGPIFLDDALAFYIMVALISLAVLYVLLRVVRSPFGHVLVAIRENQLRATFQGYPVERYKLGVFVISAVVTGVAGALLRGGGHVRLADRGGHRRRQRLAVGEDGRVDDADVRIAGRVTLQLILADLGLGVVARRQLVGDRASAVAAAIVHDRDLEIVGKAGQHRERLFDDWRDVVLFV